MEYTGTSCCHRWHIHEHIVILRVHGDSAGISLHNKRLYCSSEVAIPVSTCMDGIHWLQRMNQPGMHRCIQGRFDVMVAGEETRRDEPRRVERRCPGRDGTARMCRRSDDADTCEQQQHRRLPASIRRERDAAGMQRMMLVLVPCCEMALPTDIIAGQSTDGEWDGPVVLACHSVPPHVIDPSLPVHTTLPSMPRMVHAGHTPRHRSSDRHHHHTADHACWC